MTRTPPGAAVAVTAVFVAALVVAGTVGSLGSVLAFGAGGLVLAGAVFGRFRVALIPVAIAGALAAVALLGPRPDAGDDWTPVIAMAIVALGVAGSVCVAVGALIRRLGRAAADSGR